MPKTLTLDADLNWLVIQIQYQILYKEGIPIEQCRLIYDGKQLHPFRTLRSYNIILRLPNDQRSLSGKIAKSTYINNHYQSIIKYKLKNDETEEKIYEFRKKELKL